jgi:hypothetical protein
LGGRGDAASPRWLDVLHQKREFSKAWMALLARRLPDDIYRKVRTPAARVRFSIELDRPSYRWLAGKLSG